LTSQKARWAARSLLDAPEEHALFWQEIVELGWLGLHIDEEHGGSGYGLPELVVVSRNSAVRWRRDRSCDRHRLGSDRQRGSADQKSGCCRG